MHDLISSVEKWRKENARSNRFLLGIAAAIGLAMVLSGYAPYLPHTLSVYLIIAAFWKLKDEWIEDRGPREMTSRITFPVVCTLFMALITFWFGTAVLYGPYFPPQILVAALALLATVGMLLSLWLARLYLNSMVRLELLEQIVRESTGVDPAEKRRTYFAAPQWHDRLAGSRLLRQIARNDLLETRFGSESKPQ
jgi:hypothetical protein